MKRLRVDTASAILAGMETANCGTTAGYHRHTKTLKEPACDACKAAVAKYRRERRWAQGGYKWRDAECGTRSGWVRHMKRGEASCKPCRAAQAEYMRGYRAAKRRARLRGSWLDVILDYLETFGPITPQELVWRIGQRHADVNPATVRKALIRLEERGLVEFDRWAQNDVEVQVTEAYLESVDDV